MGHGQNSPLGRLGRDSENCSLVTLFTEKQNLLAPWFEHLNKLIGNILRNRKLGVELLVTLSVNPKQNKAMLFCQRP